MDSLHLNLKKNQAPSSFQHYEYASCLWATDCVDWQRDRIVGFSCRPDANIPQGAQRQKEWRNALFYKPSVWRKQNLSRSSEGKHVASRRCGIKIRKYERSSCWANEPAMSQWVYRMSLITPQLMLDYSYLLSNLLQCQSPYWCLGFFFFNTMGITLEDPSRKIRDSLPPPHPAPSITSQ